MRSCSANHTRRFCGAGP